jgi:hypothetical protein
MKKIHVVFVFASLMLILCLQANVVALSVPVSSATAQQDTPQKQNESTGMADAKVFKGNVTRDNGQFVLMETGTKAKYWLDDQAKAKEHEGKKVTITGTLDPTSKVIHIAAIENASAD